MLSFSHQDMPNKGSSTPRIFWFCGVRANASGELLPGLVGWILRLSCVASTRGVEGGDLHMELLSTGRQQ